MIRTHALARLALAAAVVASIAATAPTPFHTTLTKSSPANHDTLTVAPKTLRLWFSEKVELKLTTVTLTRADGAALKLGALARKDTANAPVTAVITTPVVPGKYTVMWKAPGDDGHPSTGKFEFVLKAKP